VNWHEWIKAVIQYKDTSKEDVDKYVEFQNWGEELLKLRERKLDVIEKELLEVINENFEQNKQIGDSYGLVQSVLREFAEYLEKLDKQKYSPVIEDVVKVNDFIENQVCILLGTTSDETGKDTVSKSYEMEISRLRDTVIALRDEVKEHGKDIKNNTTSVIISNVEILGIFVAIAFALFGIFNLTTTTISIANLDICRIIFVASLLGLILFNLLFLLLYAISRFTDKSIAMNCSKTNNNDVPCQNCQKRKHLKWWCKLKHKFTYLFVINAVCIIGIVGTLIMRIWFKW